MENLTFYGKYINIKNEEIINKIKKVITNNENSKDKSKEILYTSELKNKDLKEKYFAYIFKETKIENIDTESLLLKIDSEVNELLENDIVSFSIVNDQVFFRKIFISTSEDNILFFTNKCNSNCVFCPDSEEVRKNEKYYTEECIELLKLLPEEIKHIGITGGEPTLLKDDFFRILEECKTLFPNIQYTLITNGRMFFYKDFSQKYNEIRPKNTKVAIPLHGFNKETHDEITGVKNSFNQTMTGIKNLYRLGEKIEIRIVLNKTNYETIDKIADLIINNFPEIEEVNILSIELLGNAAKNYQKFWLEKEEIEISLDKIIPMLVKNGIKVNLYNFPICFLKSKYWKLSRKSITGYKVKYGDECSNCREKINCSGLFFSTYNIIKPKLEPINFEKERGKNV